jgi:hypothetical protein
MRIEERYLIAGLLKCIELPITLWAIMRTLNILGSTAFAHEWEFLGMWLGLQLGMHLFIKYALISRVINLKEMDSTLSIGATFVWSGIGGVHMVLRYFWTMFRRRTNPDYRKDFIRDCYDIDR